MRIRSVSALFIVLAILFVISVAGEVFIDTYMRTSTLFGYLAITALLTNLLAAIIIEKIDINILE